MRRLALPALLCLALLLIPAAGAFAATCTATTSGGWDVAGTWSCHAVPGPPDAVVIPAGKTVSVDAGANPGAAALTLAGGTLALGDSSELDADTFAAIGGGTVRGPQSALLAVDLGAGVQAAIDGGGLALDGAYLNVTGDGTFGVAGPLDLSDGGWLESDVDTTWSGSAPWQLGGGTAAPPGGPPPTSGFEMVAGRLTIAGPTAAQSAPGGGDGVIQLDAGATLFKQDASTTALGVGVLMDTAEIHVERGKLIGRFQGSGELDVSAGATLGLAGSDLQLAPPAIDLAGGTLEVEPGASLSLELPAAPALGHLGLLPGAALDLSVAAGTGPVDSEAPPDELAGQVAIAGGARLAIDGGGGVMGLAQGEVLSGSGELDGSLVNSAGAVQPSGALHITGDYTQGADGTLALALRGPADGDALDVDGAVALAGSLRVATAFSPAANAAPIVLAAASEPAGAFAKVLAPISATRGWVPAYGAAGVALAIGAAGAGGGGGPMSLRAPSLRPAVPVVGGRTRCDPGTWSGAHVLAYRWYRGSKPIAKATAPVYRVAPADGNRGLSCRVTARSAGGARATAASRGARARFGLTVVGVSAAADGGLSVALRCARPELRCRGSLHVLAGHRSLAQGRFSLRAPGGVVHLNGARGLARGEAATVQAAYRNRAGASRVLRRQLAVRG